MTWLAVALGGAVGACGRYGLFLWFGTVGGWPIGTMIANGVGSVLMGVLAARFRDGAAWDSPLRVFLLVGVLGALTTFSTFALEAVDAVRAGKLISAFGYVALTLCITLAGCAAGYWAGQNLGR